MPFSTAQPPPMTVSGLYVGSWRCSCVSVYTLPPVVMRSRTIGNDHCSWICPLTTMSASGHHAARRCGHSVPFVTTPPPPCP